MLAQQAGDRVASCYAVRERVAVRRTAGRFGAAFVVLIVRGTCVAACVAADTAAVAAGTCRACAGIPTVSAAATAACWEMPGDNSCYECHWTRMNLYFHTRRCCFGADTTEACRAQA